MTNSQKIIAVVVIVIVALVSGIFLYDRQFGSTENALSSSSPNQNTVGNQTAQNNSGSQSSQNNQNTQGNQNNNTQSGQSGQINPSTQREFTRAELATHTGINENDCYIALDGVVYDMTNADFWSNGEHTASNGLAKCGEDLTSVINASPHGRSVLTTVNRIGVFVN